MSVLKLVDERAMSPISFDGSSMLIPARGDDTLERVVPAQLASLVRDAGGGRAGDDASGNAGVPTSPPRRPPTPSAIPVIQPPTTEIENVGGTQHGTNDGHATPPPPESRPRPKDDSADDISG